LVFDTPVTKSFKFAEKYNLSLITEALNFFNRSEHRDSEHRTIRHRQFIGNDAHESGDLYAIWICAHLPG